MTKESLWYKDAVIYQMHVKAFQDANGDGIGDFAGLTQRLDYIQNLGVNAVWLLPFYPSPLRDDGYDIAYYCDVHPDYGTLDDFRQFIDEAHRRGLKVITELVINHTSDQHPWFQKARRAAPGSPERDFYIWSDDDEKLAGTRIIFTDTETSNWAWDPVAGQYYWHRFFSHQPDLNHNNPRVVEAVIEVMRFWMDMGVDGVRLDAIPYLCVQEGTNNENLPQTHAVLKRMRAAMDEHYRDRMFLAEANQWPEDVREYFGDGDECHMAYHFPLMPRIFMAVALEDRYPITEILRQTPDIPENCQWAIFLRNHDELTLEMVTDRERDYMYQMYAQEPRMRINVGIRRRLAPLLSNDTDRIKLMNSLLLSMPGSPVIYYGDEIGMGDNIYIGDRDGVRTPMQWSIDRNAGFSRADPQRLYLPTIMDPIYGYQAVNVEAQSRDPSSLLNWTRRILAVRSQYQCFGRGSLEHVRPKNRKLIAYVRSQGSEVVLCVANLAQTAQAVELDLSKYKGRVPVELMGRNAFPPIGELPYFLTLPAHGFFWLLLSDTEEPPQWHVDRLPATELPVLVLAEGLTTFLVDGGREPNGSGLARRTIQQLEQEVLPEFLPPRTWFSHSRVGFNGARLGARSLWRSEQKSFLLAFVEASSGSEGLQRYFLPLTIVWEESMDGEVLRTPEWTLAKVREHARIGALIDAYADPTFCLALLRCAAQQASIAFAGGELRFHRYGDLPSLSSAQVQAVEHGGAEPTHTSIILDDKLVLRAYRRVEAGPHPDVEMGNYMTRAGFKSSAALLASVTHVESESTVIASLFAYVGNQGDAWAYALDHLDRYAADMFSQNVAAAASPHALFTRHMRTLGRRLGTMHGLLAQAGPQDPAFAPEPFGRADLERCGNDIREAAEALRASIVAAMAGLQPDDRAAAERLVARHQQLIELASELAGPGRESSSPREASHRPTWGAKTRVHGNLYLSKVLLVADDLLITGFEGDSRLAMAQRRRKDTPLYDVATVLCSLEHARAAALERATVWRPDLAVCLEPALMQWRQVASEAFLKGYREKVKDVDSIPAAKAAFMRQLRLIQVGLALRELGTLLGGADPARIAAPIAALEELIGPASPV